jgi:dihydroorotate dehydrogenase electron transfer subunit
MLRPPELTPRAEPTWDDALVVEHEVIDGYYHRLVLHSPSITGRATAGQFVMITVPSDGGATVLLPRPMAIHRRRVDTGNLEVIFSVLGRGTAALARIAPGDSLLLTGPLGRGFELPAGAASVLLIAHGSGICAVMTVAEDARAAGMTTSAMLSTAFRSTALGEPDCRELGIDAVFVAEDDGSNTIGLITADLRQRFDTSPPSVIMVCGSGALARAAVALGQRWRTPVQVSVEAHMACGLGYCHGCAAPVATRADEEGPLVCRDGPVFDGYVVA